MNGGRTYSMRIIVEHKLCSIKSLVFARLHPSLVGVLYNGSHNGGLPLLHGGIFMESLSPSVRELLTEKFHALLDECDLVSENAAFGKTFDDLETFFLIQRQSC